MSTATVERQNVTSDYGDGTPQQIRTTIGVVTVTFGSRRRPSDRTLQRWRQMRPFEATTALFRWISRGVAERSAASVVDGPWGGRLEAWAARSDESRRQWRRRHPGVNPTTPGHYARRVTDRLEDLAPRQRQIVKLLAEDGLTQAQAADRLAISVRTVETHLVRIRERTGSATTLQAIARLSRRQLAPPGASEGTPTADDG